MRNSTSFVTVVLATTILAVAGVAQAQSSPASAGASGTAGGDANSGKQIATSGAPGGAAACVNCHGAQGEGNAAANFPRIAGQPQGYLARQLRNYANGSRANPVMAPIAKALTPQQIDAVSAYYAALAAPSPRKPASKASAKAVKRGQVLANVGDEKIGVQACANCHGPGGIGQPPFYPYLAGQHSGYLIAQLQEWKGGTRKTDPSQQMTLIAKRLDFNDIEAVTAYFSTQPAPPPAAQRVGTKPGATGRPAQPGAGSTVQPPPGPKASQGVGTEQGATPGGGQGPSGGTGTSGGGSSGSEGAGTR